MLELDHNHRSGSDKSYAQLLSSIRVGRRQPEHMRRLKQRVRRGAIGTDGIVLCALREDVRKENMCTLDRLRMDTNCDVVTIRASDSWENADGKVHMVDPDVCAWPNAEQNGGMETDLQLAVGARIQVRRNIDKTDGIVNGACGTLVAFREKDVHGIPGLSIRFDNSHVGAIQRRMTGEKNVTYVDPKDVTYTGTDRRKITVTGQNL